LVATVQVFQNWVGEVTKKRVSALAGAFFLFGFSEENRRIVATLPVTILQSLCSLTSCYTEGMKLILASQGFTTSEIAEAVSDLAGRISTGCGKNISLSHH
jgi:hypothetical protein